MGKHNNCKILYERLVEKELIDEVEHLLTKEDHSYGMILDWIKKYHSDILINLDFGLSAFSKFLKRKNLNFDFKAYNKKSNYWKLQYRFSPEELKLTAQQGAQKTLNVRKTRSAPYNSKQSIDYWISNGFSEEEAILKKREFTNINSPRRIEFWLKKGLSKTQAENVITQHAISGNLSALKKTQKPKTEKILINFFQERNIRFTTQFKIKNIHHINEDRRKSFIYDIYLPDYNLLIEANGTYWHCDPRFFNKDDNVFFPGKRKFLAKDIWKNDEVKTNEALKQGYKHVSCWEHDINNQTYKEIFECIILQK
jgi:hypothetical protein